MLCFQSLLAIPGPAPLGEVVHGGKLDEGGKDERVADGNEPIHGCSVGHFRERVPGTNAECGHGQHSCHPWAQTKVVTSLNRALTSPLEMSYTASCSKDNSLHFPDIRCINRKFKRSLTHRRQFLQGLILCLAKMTPGTGSQSWSKAYMSGWQNIQSSSSGRSGPSSLCTVLGGDNDRQGGYIQINKANGSVCCKRHHTTPCTR